jgi:hypothetical protein
MRARRSFRFVLLLAGALAVTACEPYMSMTDQVPSQTRRAAALLPETPQYVGMVDVETALREVEALKGMQLADSLRRVDNPYLNSFLDATDLDLRSDVRAVYGAMEGKEAISAVVFGSLTAEQMDCYLAEAPAGAGRATTYRGAPLYHLALGPDRPDADTLRVAFVDEGTMAVAPDAAHVTAMVDRHRAEGRGLGSNDDYMALVERVGRGSTAWIAGRSVVETALQDSTREAAADESETRGMTRAGLQGALAEWSDRVLGLSEVSGLEGGADERLGRLTRQLREQAVSVRLTDAALEGQVYLTMRDEESAARVVDVAEGVVAVLRLSADELDERHRNLLDDVELDRTGAIVRVRFSLDRALLREQLSGEEAARAARRVNSPIRPVSSTIRR